MSGGQADYEFIVVIFALEKFVSSVNTDSTMWIKGFAGIFKNFVDCFLGGFVVARKCVEIFLDYFQFSIQMQ